MIDPALISADICDRESVNQLNELLARLEARKADCISLQEPESSFRVSNLIRVYCQAHVRRCLSLFESAYSLFFTGNGLVSFICVRAIYEDVASFCHYEQQLHEKLLTGDLSVIATFVSAKAHATRIDSLIKDHGDGVKAVNILTMIDKLSSLRPGVRDEYNFLSDHSHPNSFGVIQFFASKADDNDIVTFSDEGQNPQDNLYWIIVGCHMLKHFEAALKRIDEALPILSQKGREQSPMLAAKPDAERSAG